MPDLIDREELLNNFENLVYYYRPIGKEMEMYKGFLKTVKDMPQADTERHAKWIYTNNLSYKCSNCETLVLKCDTDNYCPHCGCRMDGDA